MKFNILFLAVAGLLAAISGSAQTQLGWTLEQCDRIYPSTASGASWSCCEYSGLGSNQDGATQRGLGAAITGPIGTTTLTTTNANALVFCFASTAGNVSFSPGSGYTTRIISADFPTIMAQDQITFATGSFAGPATFPGSPQTWVELLLALKGSGSPGPTPERRVRRLHLRRESPSWPLKTTTSGRYLVDSAGKPYLLWCDTAWGLAPMPLTGTNSITTYFADRQSRGFNTVFFNLFAFPGTASSGNFATHDGILPFNAGSATGVGSNNTYDISQPNPAYFARIVSIVNLAYSYGLTVVLNVFDNIGWATNWVANGTSKCRSFGTYVGNTFKSCPNVIYSYGDDYQDWQTNSRAEAAVAAVVAGIRSADSDHIHLGVELNFINSTTFDDANWVGLDGNAVYTYYPMYVESYHAYSQSTKAIWLIETNYEAENYSNDQYFYVDDGGPVPSGTFSVAGSAVVRKQVYWGLTSGLCGFNFAQWWTADNMATNTNWYQNLNASAGTSGSYLVTQLLARNWWKAVPDTGHGFCTAGYGTRYAYPGIVVGDLPAPKNAYGSVPADTYCTATLASDGSFGMVYVPKTSSVTINMSRLSGMVATHWMDPVSGALTTISGSPFVNSGSRTFTSPGTNSDGSSTDWLLVLDGTGVPTPTPTPTPTVTPTPTPTGTPTPHQR